jgi:hypothetical protein
MPHSDFNFPEPSALRAGANFMFTQTQQTFSLVERLEVASPDAFGAGEGWVIERAPGKKQFLPDGSFRQMLHSSIVTQVG